MHSLIFSSKISILRYYIIWTHTFNKHIYVFTFYNLIIRSISWTPVTLYTRVYIYMYRERENVGRHASAVNASLHLTRVIRDSAVQRSRRTAGSWRYVVPLTERSIPPRPAAQQRSPRNPVSQPTLPPPPPPPPLSSLLFL